MRGVNQCMLCGRDMSAGDRNFFSADGIATCLVCPQDDPDGSKLREAQAERLAARQERRFLSR